MLPIFRVAHFHGALESLHLPGNKPMKIPNSHANIAYVGLGANLGRPAEAIETAIRLLPSPQVIVLRQAHRYRSAPLGPQDQPDFINTVVELKTNLAPETLLRHLKSIETQMGRTKAIKWGPRIIDLDLLLYNEVVLRGPTLHLPHPQMHKRRFVLEPLAELARDLVVPGLGESVKGLVARLEDPAIHQIA